MVESEPTSSMLIWYMKKAMLQTSRIAKPHHRTMIYLTFGYIRVSPFNRDKRRPRKYMRVDVFKTSAVFTNCIAEKLHT